MYISMWKLVFSCVCIVQYEYWPIFVRACIQMDLSVHVHLLVRVKVRTSVSVAVSVFVSISMSVSVCVHIQCLYVRDCIYVCVSFCTYTQNISYVSCNHIQDDGKWFLEIDFPGSLPDKPQDPDWYLAW